MNNLERDFLQNEYIQEEKEDWRKDLAIAKFEYQKQKEADKQELKRQQVIAQKKQARQELIGLLLSIAGKVFVFTCKATLYMILAPLFIIACFGGGFLGGMIKLK